MEVSGMVLPPMPDPPGGTARAAALPFALPELDLGSISKRTAKRKAVLAVEDDEDPLEEAQLFQVLQRIQELNRSKEKKRKQREIAAKAKGVAAGVRKEAAKRAEETRSKQEDFAADLRRTMDDVRDGLQEEATLAASLLQEQNAAMKAAVDTLNEKYDEAAEVHRSVKLLEDYMRQHFQTVRAHVEGQVDVTIAETDETIQGIYSSTK